MVADLDAFRSRLGDKQRAAFDSILVRAADDPDVEGFGWNPDLPRLGINRGKTVLDSLGIPKLEIPQPGSGPGSGRPAGGAGPVPT